MGKDIDYKSTQQNILDNRNLHLDCDDYTTGCICPSSQNCMSKFHLCGEHHDQCGLKEHKCLLADTDPQWGGVKQEKVLQPQVPAIELMLFYVN